MSNIKNHIVWRVKSMMSRYMIWRSRPSLSWWRTLFINFYFLPLRQAKKLPIYVYGNLRLSKLEGSIEIDCPDYELRRGMVSINALSEASGIGDGNTEIILGKGKMIFTGPVRIGRGSKYLIYNGGVLKFGKNVYVNHEANIACCNSIIIDDECSFGPSVQVFDTNFHFTYNANGMVKRNNGVVYLGKYCWIGARSSIMKNVTLPDRTTVASNSLVNKNVVATERCLIAGSPAKLIVEEFSRVFDYSEECRLARFFMDNPDAKETQVKNLEC